MLKSVCAGVLAILLPPATCTAQAVHPQLAGLWLAAPESYDVWVERGIEIAAYPVLRISPDGKFTLFRLRAACEPDGPDGKPYHPDSAEKAAACAAARERSAKDGFTAAYARVSAAGDVKLAGAKRLRFVFEEAGSTPSEWASIHRQLRERGHFNSEEAARRYENFHSTFYVLDGREATFERKHDRLTLKDVQLGQALEFRAARAEVLDSAMAMPLAFDFLSGQYFRCLVEKLEKSLPPKREPGSELGKAARLAHDSVVLINSATLLAALNRAGRATPEQVASLRESAGRFQEMRQRLAESPIARAVRDKQLGKFLGCPARDKTE
jgi:hypothetical protein